MVLATNTIRFGFDLYYVIQQVLMNAHYFKECPHFDDTNLMWDIIFNSVTTILTFYLPIFIVLRIYNLEDRPEFMCQSLIISGTNQEE